MAVLTAKAILEADDLPRKLVPVTEWGGEVYVRTLSGTERDAFEASLVKVVGKGKNRTTERDATNFTAKLAALCICDEQGKRLFTNSQIVELGKKSSAALSRVVAVAMELNGVTDEAVESAEGNSESAPSDSSISS